MGIHAKVSEQIDTEEHIIILRIKFYFCHCANRKQP